MMQQLYIDGHLADIGENVDVALELKSNLLTGAENFAGNSSLTITLPTTVRNRDIISHADIVQGGENVPYQFHNIEYYRNGVQIIKGGVGRLLSTKTDGIEIAIVWGIRSAIDALMEADDTLNAISTDAAITFNATPVVSSYASALVSDVFYAAMDCARHGDEYDRLVVHVSMGYRDWDITADGSASSYLHPSVRMSWILARLAVMYGVTFSWDATSQAYIDTLIVPLITKKPNAITYSSGYVGNVLDPSSWGGAQGNWLRFQTVSSSVYIAESALPTDAMVCALDFTGLMRFNIVLRVAVTDYRAAYGYRLRVVVGNYTSYSVILHEGMQFKPSEVTGGYADVAVEGVIPVTMVYGDAITVRIDCSLNGIYTDSYGGGIAVQSGTVYVNATVDKKDDVQPGQQFPVAGNLPDIKPIDLIKFLCAVTGTFPVQSSTASVLTFKPVADVFDWSQAEDWSRRLLSVTDRPVAAVKAYAVDGWAQQNWFRWKEDDTVKGDYDGSINVDNETLGQSRDVITFPFAATDGNNVPLYEFEGGTADWSKVEPRVLRLFDDSGSAAANFDIDMSVMLEDIYGSLSASLAHPSVITETIRISDVELADIDESKAIYLQQHGAYFALLSLTTKGNETAEVKLLKLTKEA